ncbi:MAG: hypothetical protein EBU70_04290 [Actinobacteria bacterium]|nr:hypothetical protein [Actinomycetota bacterium]
MGSADGLRIAVLPLDFADLPFRESDHAALRRAAREVVRYYDAMSYGRAVVTVSVATMPDVVRMPEPARTYGVFAEYADIGRIAADALAAAPPSLQLGTYDMVALETARDDGSRFWPVAMPVVSPIPSSSGPVGGVVLAGGWQAANWRAIAHEVAHVWLGFEDLYDMTPPPAYDGTFREYDLMNSFRGAAPELTAWHRFLAGWLDDRQVRCVVSTTRRRTVHYLSAISDRSDLPKAVVRPLGPGRTLVVESRRNRGYDRVEDSALVYVVDSTRRSGDGPIEARAELTTDRGRRPSNERWHVPVGRTVTVEGVTIRLLASSRFGDLVEVGQG